MDSRHHNRQIVAGVRVVLAPDQAEAPGVLRPGEVGVVEGLDETATGASLSLSPLPPSLPPSPPPSLRPSLRSRSLCILSVI